MTTTSNLEKLSSPFWVLIIGAIISIVFSGLLIPRITETWQNHQKQLEVKTELVTHISKTVSDFIITAQLVEARSPSLAAEDYHKAYRNWSEASADIESQLMAYYPNDKYAKQWHDYTVVLEKFYFLSAVNIPASIRQERIHFIQDYLSTKAISDSFSTRSNNIHWQDLVNRNNITAYQGTWFAVRDMLVEESHNLIKNILNTSIPAFPTTILTE
jgi:uncharacterized membrane-anchored protein YhcB (DUF1043 family)